MTRGSGRGFEMSCGRADGACGGDAARVDGPGSAPRNQLSARVRVSLRLVVSVDMRGNVTSAVQLESSNDMTCFTIY